MCKRITKEEIDAEAQRLKETYLPSNTDQKDLLGRPLSALNIGNLCMLLRDGITYKKDIEAVESILKKIVELSLPLDNNTLDVLRNGPIRTIQDKIDAVEHLQSIPLYSKDELRHHISLFYEIQKANRLHLINTGILSKDDQRSPYFCKHIGHLLPVKSPVNGSPLFTPKDQKRVKKIRECLFFIKQDIFIRIMELLHHQSACTFWEITTDCIKKNLEERLSAEEVTFLSGLEDRSDNFNPGGLKDMLHFIGLLEEEFKISIYAKIRMKLDEFTSAYPYGRPLVESINNNPTFNISSYLEILLASDELRIHKRILESALDVYLKLKSEFDNFIRFHEARLETFIEKLRDLSGNFQMNIVTSNKDVIDEKEKKRGFPKLDGLRWQDITITFQPMGLIRVQARNVDKKYSAEALGFLDHTKGHTPDSNWKYLQILAQEEKIPIKPDLADNEKELLYKRLSIIRARLKKFFHIEDDPFYDAKKLHEYIPKFKVKDQSHVMNAASDKFIQTSDEWHSKGYHSEEYLREKHGKKKTVPKID